MNYTIIRSKRKTMAIHITKDADVKVRAPLRMPQCEIDRFIIQKQAWIEKTQQKILLQNESIPQIILTKKQAQELIDKAKSIIPERVEYYSRIMNVVPNFVKINGAKTRFGSCSGKNSLNFSWRLMMASDIAIDYVVVHELAHIREHNHSARFWAVVASVLPDYKDRQQALKAAQLHITVTDL